MTSPIRFSANLIEKEKGYSRELSECTSPRRGIKVGSTPAMTEETVVPGILRNHLAPKGKTGYLVVDTGALQFVWEDDADNVLDADSEHQIGIFP